jgi:flagellar biosynthesis protein FlgN
MHSHNNMNTAQMSRALSIPFLREMYAQDSTAVSQLTALLIRERELLEGRQLHGLQEIVTQKDHLLDTLAFNAKQREQLLQAAGLENSLAGWAQLLISDATTQTLIPQWQTLTRDFIECQKANEINGRMINRSKQTLTQLLNLIRGQVAAPSLYTQKGSATQQSRSQTLVRA